MLLITEKNSFFSPSAILTDTDWLVVFPSTIALMSKDCVPDAVGISLIRTSAELSSSIETVCATLTRFAHDSNPDAETMKSLSPPLFVMVALIISSSPSFAVDSRSAVIEGDGPLQFRISNSKS